MSGLLIAALCVVAWLTCGHLAGRGMAARSFRAYRKSYRLLAAGDPEFGKSSAAITYLACLAAGPLALLPLLADVVVSRNVPELVEVRAAARRAELAELQRQIDQAHKELGIAPLRDTP